MKTTRLLFLACCFIGIVVVSGGIARAQEDPVDVMAPADAGSIQQGVESLVLSIDAAKDAGAASPDELIVLAFQLAKDRAPTPVEFFVTRAIRDENGLSTGEVFAIIVQNGSETMWDDCRAFLEKASPASFLSTPESQALAASLAATPVEEVFAEMNAIDDDLNTANVDAEKDLPPAKAGVAYNTYFGDIHNHSSLSDGSGSATQAYQYARDVAKVDYFSLSDHGENMYWHWPWSNNYGKLVSAANQYNADGKFVALYGFEYGNPFMGHITVTNTTDYTGAVANPTTGMLYSWLKARPSGFARYNHPGSYDEFGAEFSHFALTSSAVPQMVGVEAFNKGDAFDAYYYVNAYGSGKTYMDLANSKGWRLGALGGWDSHGADWGTATPWRTGVLATALTRAAIIDAYKNRRFYATENKDLYVDFRCAGYPMGSVISGVASQFTVSARDAGGEILKEMRLYRNGVLLQTTPVSGSSAEVTFTDAAPNSTGYYYVIVALTTGNHGGHPDEAITSPIWISSPVKSAETGCNAAPGAFGIGGLGRFGDMLICAMTIALLCGLGAWMRGIRSRA